ncbi:MAG: porin family protein [Gammaproteobacteria bacterium]|nr:porin family protein [Gammaproteobacteria bacterium]
MKLNKTQTALGVAAVLAAGALAAPTASADARVEALEAQVNQMSQMLQEMQGELNRVRDAASRSASENTAKVMELDEWAASVKSAPAEAKSKDHMVLLRGGWARNDGPRGNWTTNDLVAGGGALVGGNGSTGDPLVGSGNGTRNAWYFGGGFDFSTSDDLFGLWDGAEVLAELMVEYKEFNDETRSVVTGQNVTINQVNLSASPKIKFLKGSDFRPWLIPIGFDINIVSPPSGAVTVFSPGAVFGAGADYRIYENIYVGADVRYHWAADTLDGVDTDTLTAGGYIGLGF